jgi:hypothetical protein
MKIFQNDKTIINLIKDKYGLIYVEKILIDDHEFTENEKFH